VRLAFSLWNIGEVLGALNKARHLNRVSEEDCARAKRAFLSETRRLARLRLAMIVPARSAILVDSWRLLEKHRIYQRMHCRQPRPSTFAPLGSWSRTGSSTRWPAVRA